MLFVPSVFSEDLPLIPASFYGNVIVSGGSASVGTVIEARINDIVRSSITTTAIGTYGTVTKLSVEGNTSDAGKIIVFCINNKKSGHTAWNPAIIQEINLTTTSEDCTVQAPSGGSGSTGGGGGSSGGGVVDVNSQTSASKNILAGGSASFSFTKTPIDQITVKASLQISSGTITVKEIDKPSSAPFAISSEGSVYKYLEITPTFTNDKISEAKIRFKISKTWVNTNNITSGTITLKKLINNQWVALPTVQVSSDSTNYIFEGTTTSFSTYAVTGSKNAAPVVPANNVTSPSNPPAQNSMGSNVSTLPGNQSGTPPAETPSNLLIGAVVIIIVIAAIVLVVKRPSRSKKKR